MFHQPIEADPTPHPASKWTPQVRVRFLEHLSRKGNVRAACLLIGVSTETAYRLRRRDRAFARGWDAAIVHARRAAEHVLADRAIDGVLVDIYHRGEWVASQRKYDTRLLLAHLARLDQQVKAEAEADAERFDEILAGIAGEPVPAEFAGEDEVLGLDRESFAGRAALIARLEAERTAGEEEEHPTIEERQARMESCAEAQDEARAEALWQWDSRHAELCAAVDAVLEDLGEEAGEECGEDTPEPPLAEGDETAAAASPGDADFSLRTVSTESTPCQPAAGPEANEAGAEGGREDDRP